MKKNFQRLHDFAQILSKSATETVIEALRQVIVEFNQNLMEQFGEKFQRIKPCSERLGSMARKLQNTIK